MQGLCKTNCCSCPFILPHLTFSVLLSCRPVQEIPFQPFFAKAPLSSYLLWKPSCARTSARREYLLTFILRKKLPFSETPEALCWPSCRPLVSVCRFPQAGQAAEACWKEAWHFLVCSIPPVARGVTKPTARTASGATGPPLAFLFLMNQHHIWTKGKVFSYRVLLKSFKPF